MSGVPLDDPSDCDGRPGRDACRGGRARSAGAGTESGRLHVTAQDGLFGASRLVGRSACLSGRVDAAARDPRGRFVRLGEAPGHDAPALRARRRRRASPRHPPGTSRPSHSLCMPRCARSAWIAPADRRSASSSPPRLGVALATTTPARPSGPGAAGETSQPPWRRCGRRTTASPSPAPRRSLPISRASANRNPRVPARAATPGPTCAAPSRPGAQRARPPGEIAPAVPPHHPALARPAPVAGESP